MLSLPFFLKVVKTMDCLVKVNLFHTIPTLRPHEKKAFENIVGKEENAGNQHFLR